jgi:hypothetical protein
MGILSIFRRVKINGTVERDDLPVGPLPVPFERPGRIQLKAFIKPGVNRIYAAAGSKTDIAVPAHGPLNVVRSYNPRRCRSPF